MEAFIVSSFFLLTLAAVQVTAQVKSFTYPELSTAAYPPGTGLIYSSGTIVKHVGGTTVIYPSSSTVLFESDSEFYVQQGPVNVVAGTNITFGNNAQVTFPPGTTLKYISDNVEVKYQQFNGNTHTLAQYPLRTSARFYCSSNCNLILFQAGTNPLIYYNPGGSTQFGSSALPVEKEEIPPQMTRTYGSYGGGGGYSYCSGYSSGGYPQTTYYNYNTGYRSTCMQTGPSSYSYGGGSSGGGGYSMAGGSCYGGRNYYGGSSNYYG